MPTGIGIHHGIVPTVCIEVKSVNGFRIKVFYRIGVEESARFGVVEARLQIVKSGLGVEIVAAVTEGVSVTNLYVYFTTRLPRMSREKRPSPR